MTKYNYGDWSLTEFFSGADQQDFIDYLQLLKSDVQELDSVVAHYTQLSAENFSVWVQALVKLERLHSRYGHALSYIECCSAADVRNVGAQKGRSTLDLIGSLLTGLEAYYSEMARTADKDLYCKLYDEEELDLAKGFLDELKENAEFRLSVAQEQLAGSLQVDGLSAWSNLYSSLVGGLSFQGYEEDTLKELPISQLRSQLNSSDAKVRHQAFESGNKAFAVHEKSFAAALNSIAGSRLTLNKARGEKHFLDPALRSHGVSTRSIEAMMEAVSELREVALDFLQEKARLMNLKTLRFPDLGAELKFQESEQKLSWDDVWVSIEQAFRPRYPGFADFAQKARNKRWIDYTKREGKGAGGFMTESSEIQEIRIFMTFNETLGDVQTLVHELGHGYHNEVMNGYRAWARSYSMPLAETASTFAETMYTDSLLQSGTLSREQRLDTLLTRLSGATAFLCNTPMRYHFEKRFYEERAQGLVSIDRIKEIMVEEQQRSYGTILDPAHCDPYFWASKLHFYIDSVSFYNFPYTFGYLFSMVVYQLFLDQGSSFIPTYERLLQYTGQGSAEEVVQHVLGQDIQKPEFWMQCRSVLEQDLKSFRQELGSVDI